MRGRRSGDTGIAPGASVRRQKREEVTLANLNFVVHDLTPEDVSKGITDGRYLLVDVREPNEIAAEAFPDAVVVALSTFDLSAIPDPQGKQVVFACRSGKRSVSASLAAQAAGLPYDKHLDGGILGWKAAGLPTRSGG
ncbi:rhodanese-like protein [Nitrobacter winogradskyi Nb-255]|uniref:Rhodanese-like protein n=1 Tax=Nitrobacter winogradskyi (strain ATCC 25391 / DSM 10237 / CIP 104748 / NCIMB 11846 / Nb-255) TaxID=323098 RepID=Q3ST90_NITWN|nr:rhodanese-like protein [Nitrobacter winogradskyi Nb-255]